MKGLDGDDGQDQIFGGDGDDVGISGGSRFNRVEGEADDDDLTVINGEASDNVYGGGGYDFCYVDAPFGVVIDNFYSCERVFVPA